MQIKKSIILKIVFFILSIFLFGLIIRTQEKVESVNNEQLPSGLHGYISFGHEPLPTQPSYSAGMGFYASVWSLIEEPLAGFQIGLPSTWIIPDNSDNHDKPLCPEGTLARKWTARGPTFRDVFQTIEGGIGYWAGNHFRYGPPKFSMNGTPQCYDYEIGSPGWSFFYSDAALPDDRLGIAQISNHLLIPPDGLTFSGNPNGDFLGYAWMALPFTDPTTVDMQKEEQQPSPREKPVRLMGFETGNVPTGEQWWTCFLSSENFKGPIAAFIPETWSKIGKLFNYPFLFGRGLDTRPGIAGGGAMEINTVPRFEARDSQGNLYVKIPLLKFPVDNDGRALLVQDVTYYSKSALYNTFKAWRDGETFCSGEFEEKGAWKPKLSVRPLRLDISGTEIIYLNNIINMEIFEKNIWGLKWLSSDKFKKGIFPQYFKYDNGRYIPVGEFEVPLETGLHQKKFHLAKIGNPYTSPQKGAWVNPGPKLGPFKVKLADGSTVTYYWYRFIDQPAFQQYSSAWSEDKKAKLQALIEKIHATWPLDRDYMAPPSKGKLVKLDPALIVKPPPGLEVGYVPIVTRQEKEY